MKKSKIIILFIFCLIETGYGQKIYGTYEYTMGFSGDVYGDQSLILKLKKDQTFVLVNVDHLQNNDTTFLSKGSYRLTHDTLSLFSVYDHPDSLFFYASYSPERVDAGSLKVSFKYDNYSHGLIDEIEHYYFFGFTSDFKKIALTPYDTIPDHHNASLLMNPGERIRLYFSYYLKVPSDYKYLMIYTLPEKLWGEFFSDYSSITIDISRLKGRSIAIRDNKMLFRDFVDLNFLDVTNYTFIIKNNSITSTKPVFPQGTLSFKKRK